MKGYVQQIVKEKDCGKLITKCRFGYKDEYAPIAGVSKPCLVLAATVLARRRRRPALRRDQKARRCPGARVGRVVELMLSKLPGGAMDRPRDGRGHRCIATLRVRLRSRVSLPGQWKSWATLPRCVGRRPPLRTIAVNKDLFSGDEKPGKITCLSIRPAVSHRTSGSVACRPYDLRDRRITRAARI
jgi:hypothetical protein